MKHADFGSCERGATLLVSLLILLVLSVLGVVAMRGGHLQNLMSANSQQAALAFNTAESGVGAVYASTSGVPYSAILQPAHPIMMTVGVGQKALAELDNATVTGVKHVACVDKYGVMGGCTGQKIDADRLGRSSANVEMSWFGCYPVGTLYPGMSTKPDAPLKAHYFRIDSSGVSGNAQTSVTSIGTIIGHGCS